MGSFTFLDWDIPYEVVVCENMGRQSSECRSMLEHIQPPIKLCTLNTNVGFWAAWNILENLMVGEYRMMMQDDTEFCKFDPPVTVSSLIATMERYKWRIMRLNCTGEEGQTTNLYSEQPHIEHISLRSLHSDYRCYPRYYPTLIDQSIYPEPEYQHRLSQQSEVIGVYPKIVAFHQNSGNSLIQTLAHETPGGLTRVEQEQLWREHEFEKYKMKRWP